MERLPSVDLPLPGEARRISWGASAKRLARSLGLDPEWSIQAMAGFSIRQRLFQAGLSTLVEKLRAIAPDISQQESSDNDTFNAFWELKRRALQAFQCSLMLKVLERLKKEKLIVVDVGDSAGTHMLYLRELTKGLVSVDTVSVNLDPRAIEKIKARGLKAMHVRAEELTLGSDVDLFTSFEMVEHLHNPAIFFRRLAKRKDNSLLLVTVPYLKQSRVGLHNIRRPMDKPVYAEDEHIFELSPKDWTLLMRHAGWRPLWSEIHYQYPRYWPLVSPLLAAFWRRIDFEGFWGVLLEKDTALSDRYQDWEEKP